MIRRRRFHFKSPPLKDLAIQRFKEWSDANKGFYTGFRDWLKENGYGPATLSAYGAATRMAIGYLRKPYWTIDPDADIEHVQVHLQNSYRTLNTQTDYRKGLRKLAEYLRLRCHRPKKEKELPWEYTIGSLSPTLQSDVREYLKHCQRAWKLEHRWERSRDTLYRLGIPLRWMAEEADLKEIRDLTPQVWFAWLDHRLAQSMMPETVNGDLTELRHLVYFLRGAGRSVCERFLLVEPLKAGYRLADTQGCTAGGTAQAAGNDSSPSQFNQSELSPGRAYGSGMVPAHAALRFEGLRNSPPEITGYRVGRKETADRAIQSSERPPDLPGCGGFRQ